MWPFSGFVCCGVMLFDAVQHEGQRSGFSMAVRANHDCPPYNDPRRESIVEEKND